MGLRPVLWPGLLVMVLAACAPKTGTAPGAAGVEGISSAEQADSGVGIGQPQGEQTAREQTERGQTERGQTEQGGTAAAETSAPPDAPVRLQPQGITVAVLLADTAQQDGWITVPVQDGALYINPQPVILRSDITDVQAGLGRSGEGLLALGLSEEAQVRLRNITEQFPNKRLALVVGRNMLAAPAYTAPVSQARLVFPVGTGQNAAAALHVITAPVEANAAPAAPASARPPESAPPSQP